MSVSLIVSTQRQVLTVLESHSVVKTYVVSTAANGAGEQRGSLQTPRGAHRIVEKIGHGLAPYAVMVSRIPTGEIATKDALKQEPNRDWIVGRILRLDGLELGFNRGGSCDTYSRYIYIHGSPAVDTLGQPCSHGCIRMSPFDVLDLYNLVDVGTKVIIA